MDTKDESRRGSGRTMATLLAAQLWAADSKVCVFVFAPRNNPNTSDGMMCKWVSTMAAHVRGNISLWSAANLQDVQDKLRGKRFDKVFVDHHIIERAEDELERRMRALQEDHAAMLLGMETIR